MTRNPGFRKRPHKPRVARALPTACREGFATRRLSRCEDSDACSDDFRTAIAELVELGIAELERMGFRTTESKPSLTRERALLELFDLCRTRGLPYDKDVIAFASTDVLAHFDRLPRVGDYYLSVGELRDRLAGLPAHMPVAYQRIEDHYFQSAGWKTYSFVFESIPMDALQLTPAQRRSEVRRLRAGKVPGVRVRQRGRRLFQEILSEYHVAWSAGVGVDDEGRRMFLIDAHY